MLKSTKDSINYCIYFVLDDMTELVNQHAYIILVFSILLIKAHFPSTLNNIPHSENILTPKISLSCVCRSKYLYCTFPLFLLRLWRIYGDQYLTAEKLSFWKNMDHSISVSVHIELLRNSYVTVGLKKHELSDNLKKSSTSHKQAFEMGC